MRIIDRRSFIAGTATTALSTYMLPASAYAQGATPTLIRGSNIFDGSSSKLKTKQDVLIEKGLVTRIGVNLSVPGCGLRIAL